MHEQMSTNDELSIVQDGMQQAPIPRDAHCALFCDRPFQMEVWGITWTKLVAIHKTNFPGLAQRRQDPAATPTWSDITTVAHGTRRAALISSTLLILD
jgi:hypothetical protein